MCLFGPLQIYFKIIIKEKTSTMPFSLIRLELMPFRMTVHQYIKLVTYFVKSISKIVENNGSGTNAQCIMITLIPWGFDVLDGLATMPLAI